MEQENFDSVVYLRKLNAQELGFRKGKPGGAGRYFFISKSCLSFFPPLSDVVLNDHVFIDVIPPFSDDIVLTNFVYHNDSTASDGTRDEYRIYLNSRNDDERKYFQPDDIVIILKIYTKEIENPEEKRVVYKLLRYQSSQPDYAKLLGLIESADIKYKSHALLNLSDITFLDEIRKIRLGSVVIPKEVIEESLKEATMVPTSEEESDTRMMRSRSFRDLILYFYGYKCAITNEDLVINYKALTNLEAAHICARAFGGGSHPSNGFALERNLHWAYDKGFFTITDDYKVQVHPEALKIKYLADLDGRELLTPEDSRSKPNKESQQWHRDNVFGIFLKSEI